MAQALLIDSDLLIDYSRRQADAVAFMRELKVRPVISAVTVAELYAGVREGRERDDRDQFVSQSDVTAVDTQIAELAGLILQQYVKSHSVGLADAIIAATAKLERAQLVTLNRKHFPMLDDVLVPYQKA